MMNNIVRKFSWKSSSNDETTYSGNGNNSNYDQGNNDSYTNSSSTSPTTTTVGTATPEDSGLSVSDIINIFVIVIGVILMFLGIAILVKSKKE